MGQKSWEFYQQREAGGDVAYPLWWICGLANAVAPTAFAHRVLKANTLYAVPFNQIRAVTVDKMAISLDMAAPQGGKGRLGIYRNVADGNSKPGQLLVDGGEIDLTGPAPGFRQVTGLNQNLAIDIRYWAVLFTNDSAAGAQVDTIPQGNQFFWGAVPKQASWFPAAALELGNQTFGPLPNPFPAVSSDKIVDTSIVIALAFSAAK